jgi:Na+-translocating ferredoxin:NAD+ oxidoreductase RnfD subunit
MSESETSPSTNPKPRAAPRRLIMRQANMKRVLYALMPVGLSAIYFFGWRVLALWATCISVCFSVEWLMASRRGQPVSMACFVSATLLGLSLPVTAPFYVAVVGSVVAILFGKEVYGGFGKNFVNPAILGRAFVYVCFPIHLTARFVPVFRGFPGGFAHWSFESLDALPAQLAGAGQSTVDAISQASPLWINKALGPEAASKAASLWDMFLGTLGGTFMQEGTVRIFSGGSAGEGCALLIALAGIYLLVTKTANWRLMLSCVAGLGFATLLLRHVLGFSEWAPGAPDVPPFLFNLLGGTTMYVVVFMVTDPVSGPKRKSAQLAYGFLIGFLVVFLRWRGVFVAAATFSLLLGNLIGPLLDIGAEAWANHRKHVVSPEEGAL